MEILPNEFYHVFNQGNNKQQVFFNRENYLYFLEHAERHVKPHCELIAYCLMPNHFHFLIYTNEHSCEQLPLGSLQITQVKNGFRQLQSNYTKGINKNANRSGSLFRQNGKMKWVENNLFSVFDYIHQNPVDAGLANKAENWEFSSFNDYRHNRKSICNMELGKKYMDLEYLKKM